MVQHEKTKRNNALLKKASQTKVQELISDKLEKGTIADSSSYETDISIGNAKIAIKKD